MDIDQVRAEAYARKYAALREAIDRGYEMRMRHGEVRQHGPTAAEAMRKAKQERDQNLQHAATQARAGADAYVAEVVAERERIRQRQEARVEIQRSAALRNLQLLIASRHAEWLASGGSRPTAPTPLQPAIAVKGESPNPPQALKPARVRAE